MFAFAPLHLTPTHRRLNLEVVLSMGQVKAPRGYENNWIPTGGKVPFPLFRFYRPTEALFDKTFVLNDLELVK